MGIYFILFVGYNKMLQYVYFSFTIYNKEMFLWKQ